jgi:hypothetical protein
MKSKIIHSVAAALLLSGCLRPGPGDGKPQTFTLNFDEVDSASSDQTASPQGVAPDQPGLIGPPIQEGSVMIVTGLGSLAPAPGVAAPTVQERVQLSFPTSIDTIGCGILAQQAVKEHRALSVSGEGIIAYANNYWCGGTPGPTGPPIQVGAATTAGQQPTPGPVGPPTIAPGPCLNLMTPAYLGGLFVNADKLTDCKLGDPSTTPPPPPVPGPLPTPLAGQATPH